MRFDAQRGAAHHLVRAVTKRELCDRRNASHWSTWPERPFHAYVAGHRRVPVARRGGETTGDQRDERNAVPNDVARTQATGASRRCQAHVQACVTAADGGGNMW